MVDYIQDIQVSQRPSTFDVHNERLARSANRSPDLFIVGLTSGRYTLEIAQRNPLVIEVTGLSNRTLNGLDQLSAFLRSVISANSDVNESDMGTQGFTYVRFIPDGTTHVEKRQIRFNSLTHLFNHLMVDISNIDFEVND